MLELQRLLAPLFLALLPAGELEGVWTGGFGSLDGDRPHFTRLTVELEVDDGRVRANGRLRRRTIEFEGELNGDRLRLEAADGTRALALDGRWEGETIVGSCREQDRELRFDLVREAPVDREALAELGGLYTFEDGSALAIRAGRVLASSEFESGRERLLYTRGVDEFSAGPSLLAPLPEAFRIRFERSEGRVTGLVLAEAGRPERRASFAGRPREEPFRFENDGVELSGTLHLPDGAGPHPAAVFVHGSGRLTRGYADEVPLFLTHVGLALFAYDKRGCGESGGTYELPDGSSDNRPHIVRRAGDVAAAVRALREHPAIDPERVGLFGVSQAGWVQPLAAAEADCAFTVTLSGGATSIACEDLFSRLADEAESDADAPPVEDLLERVRHLRDAGRDWRHDFAAQPCPGLWLYGMKDRSNPSGLCVELLEEVAHESDRDFTVVRFPNGNHGLFECRLGGSRESATLNGYVPGFRTTIRDWLVARGFASAR